MYDNVRSVNDLMEWIVDQIRETEELDNKNGDDWAVARINAMQEVLAHLHNIKSLETLI